MPSQITPCLWFDGQAEEAATFYTSIFEDGKINHIQRYGEAGKEFHKHEPGSIMVVAFEINGQSFTALNGGPQYKFNQAISFQIMCDDQDEVDYFWRKLSEEEEPSNRQHHWVTDKYGVSWQIIPKNLKSTTLHYDWKRHQTYRHRMRLTYIPQKTLRAKSAVMGCARLKA